ncbi:copper homeostasis protein CutC [Runella sp. SP2]|uniref:copper homeostasis protein CutC n=1 Tax=Runella sp. SP2 TaxID=2268026 RepID=UPI000F07ED38|nr:copper homeostasis protein CutC [Runella sp. SP2]AYQ35379.1 copper homeostasis protein CutC [Runella sp. SP2]
MQVEVCAFSIESCLNAQQAGATRIELCGGLYEGGTTPSYGLIKRAREVTTLQLYVMIRPRGGDFCYDDEEFLVMKQDIELAKELGADGVVFGLLLPTGEVDEVRTAELVALAKPLQVTFHRAFDVAKNPFEALEAVIRTGAVRILTSGQENSALDGAELLTQLAKKAAGRIDLMAGSGVNVMNAVQLAQTGVQALHLTGKAARKGQMIYQKEGVSMASVLPTDEYEIIYSDALKIRSVVEAVNDKKDNY